MVVVSALAPADFPGAGAGGGRQRKTTESPDRTTAPRVPPTSLVTGLGGNPVKISIFSRILKSSCMRTEKSATDSSAAAVITCCSPVGPFTRKRNEAIYSSMKWPSQPLVSKTMTPVSVEGLPGSLSRARRIATRVGPSINTHLPVDTRSPSPPRDSSSTSCTWIVSRPRPDRSIDPDIYMIL